MTIKHLYPNARPSLDLKFAKDKVLDPRITYSRASSGTYFDSTGTLQSAATNQARFDHDPTTGESLGLLVEEARTNVLYPSTPDFNGGSGSWSNSAPLIDNAGIAPDGTYTAVLTAWDTVSGAERLYYNTGTPSSVGVTEVHSFFVKAKTPGSGDVFSVTFQGVNWSWLNGTSSSRTFYFNFDTETFSANTNTGYGQVVTKFPNGWHRISIPAINNGTGAWNTYVAINRNTQVGNWYIWGCQRENGSFPTSYIPTTPTFTSRASDATYYDANGIIQTAATNVARSNAYLPDSNGVFKPAGLLLEAASTNLQLGSAAPYTSGGNGSVTPTLNQIAPDNTSTAVLWTESVGTGNHFYQQNVFPSPAFPAGTYTFSVFVKSNGRNRVSIKGPFTETVTFDLSTVSVVASSGSTCFITNAGNGWFRCSVTNTVASSITLYQYYVGLNSDTGAGFESYTGDGTSGAYFWGWQIEASPYPTSYIPTTSSTVTRAADVSSSSTVTRSADVASMPASPYLYGTFFAKYKHQPPASFYRQIFSVGSGGAYGAFVCRTTPGGSFANIALPGITELTQTTNAETSGFNNVAATRVVGDYALCLNGGTVAKTSSTQDNTNNSVITFMYGTTGATSGGHISRLTYYPVRLPDATLQTLTS